MNKDSKPTYEIPWMKLDKVNRWECECGFISWCTNEDAFDHQKEHALMKIKSLDSVFGGCK
jgi:hypothetical protein